MELSGLALSTGSAGHWGSREEDEARQSVPYGDKNYASGDGKNWKKIWI